MPRIVSLIASATEMVCALGFEDSLVGRSHECDYPESVRRLPICTEPKFPVTGSSLDIDQRVKSILKDGLSVYRVDENVLRQLRPDVIVTQAQCDVCAVSLRDVRPADIHTFTIPTAGTGTIDGQSVVNVDQASMPALRTALAGDQLSGFAGPH